MPLPWVAGALGVCLLAGFLVGLWWVDYRSRKRHGGIRIY
jgi:cbb3-type cytochrome oxidase subunit 3